jgi:hypothetical protein
VRTLGPNWKYRYRDSSEEILERRISSLGVRGRRVESRVKRTSVEICRREEVWVKMLGAEKRGSVEMRKKTVAIVRIRRAREIGGGTGRIGVPWMEGAARNER